MHRTLGLVLALLALLALVACPTPRSGGGDCDDDDAADDDDGAGDDDDAAGDDDDASGDDDDAAGDDDDAAPAEPGLFVYTDVTAYGYAYGRIYLPLESGFDCLDLYDGGYFYDTDQNWLVAFLIRGDDIGWEGDYEWGYSGDCYKGYKSDYEGLRCTYIYSYDDYSDADDSLTVSDYSETSVAGSITFNGETTAFDVVNCGEVEPYSGDDDDSAYRSLSGPTLQRASTQSTVAGEDRPRKTKRGLFGSAWRLRFR